MRTAQDFVPEAGSGNTTRIDIGAPPGVVWQAMESVALSDLPVTRVLMGARSLPARVMKRGSLRRSASAPLLDALASSRFTVLCREPELILTLGIVGQFWRMSGGVDAAVASAAAFVAFDRAGFVRSAIDFVLEPIDDGTRLTTHTRSKATDEATARQFGRYWLMVGAGSKVIRVELLRAVRRRAEQRSADDSVGRSR